MSESDADSDPPPEVSRKSRRRSGSRRPSSREPSRSSRSKPSRSGRSSKKPMSDTDAEKTTESSPGSATEAEDAAIDASVATSTTDWNGKFKEWQLTDSNVENIDLKKKIAQLEARLAAASKSLSDSGASEVPATSGAEESEKKSEPDEGSDKSDAESTSAGSETDDEAKATKPKSSRKRRSSRERSSRRRSQSKKSDDDD